MGKSNIAVRPNFKKYGVPFYSVAWIPEEVIKSHQKQTTDQVSDADEKSQPVTDLVTAGGGERYLALAGGGGEGRSGIPNAVVLARFDVASNTLSDEPVWFSYFLYDSGIIKDLILSRCFVVQFEMNRIQICVI